MFETPVTVVGRVVSDIESRHTQNGNLSTSFRVFSRSRRYDREREEWTDGELLAVRVQCWGELAESAALTLRKGDPVLVTGSLSTREYDAADGSRRTAVELRANAAGPNLRHCSADLLRPARVPEEPQPDWSPTQAAVLQSGPPPVTARPPFQSATPPAAQAPARDTAWAPAARPPARQPSHISERATPSPRVEETAAKTRRALGIHGTPPEDSQPLEASTAA